MEEVNKIEELENFKTEIKSLFEYYCGEITSIITFEEFDPMVNTTAILPDISDLLIAWEQFKKTNWYKSDAVDVDKKLMSDFKAIYGR